MRSFKSYENIHKKEGGSYYVVSANKVSSVTLQSPGNESQRKILLNIVHWSIIFTNGTIGATGFTNGTISAIGSTNGTIGCRYCSGFYGRQWHQWRKTTNGTIRGIRT